MQTVRQDQIIFEAGSPCNCFYIIAEGSVAAQFVNNYISLGKGDIVGVFDITCSTHTCTYQAQSDAVLIPYQYNDRDGLLAILEEKEDMRKLLLNSMNAHICDFFNIYAKKQSALKDLHNFVNSSKVRYNTMCKILHFNPKTLPFFEELDSISSDDNLLFWMNGYYGEMKKLMNSLDSSVSATFCYGYLDRSCHDLSKVTTLLNDIEYTKTTLASYLMNEDYIDFYDLYSDLYLRSQANGDDTTNLQNLLSGIVDKIKSLELLSNKFIESRVIKLKSTSVVTDSAIHNDVNNAIMQAKLANSLGEILEFSDTVPTTAAEFKKCLDEYKALPDRDSSDPAVSELRKKLAKLFNIIYFDTVQMAMQREDLPTIVKMFINFGFVDTELCGQDNAAALYKYVDTYHGHKEHGIYTILEWFTAIYKGEKVPSRNEFEVDYVQYIKTLSREGKISKDSEAEMLNDSNEKIIYELNNMFTTVNKITTGRIFTYCPVLLESNLIRSVNDLVLTPDKILNALDAINAIDYSAFYHEYIFEDTKAGVKEIVRKDIRPDFILMPNVGNRGVMWQEIEGLNRRTPARMFLSAFFPENLEKAIMRMTAEYRWEMCKREMGARWNDVTSHSLTGDYCDYAQFFNKNKELSADAKEKIKSTLRRCKNSYKELFIFDYMQYIMYESTGSCRLNKIARSMLFTYCPLSEDSRKKLATNSIFDECLSKHRIATGQVLHRMDIIDKRYQSIGKDTPEELAIQRELVSR